MLELPGGMQELERRVALAAEGQKLVVEDVGDEGVTWERSGMEEGIEENGAAIVRGSRKTSVSCCERWKRTDGKAQCTLNHESFLACVRHHICV
jgi:hypothetical protein